MYSANKIKHDTIAAIATPAGQGAIGVIRISGPRAKTLLGKVWHPLNKGHIKPRELTLGWAHDSDKKLDQTLAVFMPGPNSYTAEDVAEIHTHGSTAVTQAVLSLLLDHGARVAEPGEFTKRAYLNGKIDLLQAEAVGDLIVAESETMVRLATDQLAGRLSMEIKSIRDEVIRLAAHESAALDFSEEDISAEDTQKTIEALNNIHYQIDKLLLNSSQVAVLRRGYKVALVGLPNAGKSTLLNHLLGYERSIVTSIPGTTRDTIEETINVDGINIRLIDTAGLNTKPGEVEQMGIERTKAEIKNSDLILLLVEPGREHATRRYIEDNHLFGGDTKPGERVVVIWTKSDLDLKPNPKKLAMNIKSGISVSAVNGEGLGDVRGVMARSANIKGMLETTTATTYRQIEALKSAQTQISKAQKSLADGLTSDILVVELDLIAQILGGLTGDTTNQEIIDSIFANFCVGK